MKKFLTTLALLFAVCSNIFGQYIQGSITDNNDNPVSFVSIYVKESTKGTTSNQKGNYFLELSEGDYIIVFRFIGYKTQEHQVTISENKPTTLNIKLQESAETLNEVDIVANKKDLAKEIMSNVREKRKFYLSQIKSYQCDTYFRTSLEREFKYTDTTAKDEKLKKGESGLEHQFKRENLNLIESISKLYFNNNNYKEQIIATHDYAEVKEDTENGDVQIGMGLEYGREDFVPVAAEEENSNILYKDINSSDINFYENLISYPKASLNPLLSPIASTSAASYSYTFSNSFYENGIKIYEIRVKPIFKNEALFDGLLFIEDSTWALKAVDLSINKTALSFANELNIIQNYSQIDSNVYLPVRREINYIIKQGFNEKIIGSIRIAHSNYKVNLEIENNFKPNEVKRYNEDAFDKDSTFWSNNRPIVLKQEELNYIEKADSLKRYYTSKEYYKKIDSSFNHIAWWAPFSGVGHRNRRKGTEWFIGGIFEQMNFFGIGGYRHTLPGYFNKDLKNGMKLETDGFIDYGFRNKDVKGSVGAGLTYFPKKFVRTYVKFGDFYEQINPNASFTSVWSRSNYVRTKSVLVKQRMEITNGLFAELSFDYADKIPLQNIQFAPWTDSIFRDLNTPIDFDRYTKSEIRLDVEYRPFQKYIIKKNKKYIQANNWPTLRASYRKGIPKLFNSEVNFDYFEISAKDEMKLARFGSSRWHITMGSFLNQKNLRILEWKYFRGSDFFFFSDPLTSFQLLDANLNTPNEYFRANYIHHFDGAILGKLPLISLLKLQLAGGAGTLVIPDSDFAHIEFFGGIERPTKLWGELFRFSLWGVTASNPFTTNTFDYSIKFGISMYNPFFNKWDY